MCSVCNIMSGTAAERALHFAKRESFDECPDWNASFKCGWCCFSRLIHVTQVACAMSAHFHPGLSEVELCCPVLSCLY